MRDGAIEQISSPSDIYEQPATAFVSEFVGETNRLSVNVTGGRISLDGQSAGLRQDMPDGPAELHFRPGPIQRAEDGFEVRVSHASRRGGAWRVDGSTSAGQRMIVEIPATDIPEPTTGSTLRLRPSALLLFPVR